MDCERSDSGNRAAVEVGSACQYVTDDGVTSGGDELEVRDCGAEPADVVDDPDFVVAASERLAHHVEDAVVVERGCGAHLHGVCSGRSS